MNEVEIECDVCEEKCIVYSETGEDPVFCPYCGSPLTETEVHDV
jgi:ribosomal protein S27E